MFVGIDLGTSSIKMLVMDDKYNIKKVLSKNISISYPQEGHAEQNALEWKESMLELLKEITQKYEVKSISFSGQMHGLVMLDDGDNLIDNVILWNDSRSIEECKYLNNEIGISKLKEYTSSIAFTGFVAPKLLWLKKHKREKFDRISKIMLPKDYLAYILTGKFVTDHSDASGTLLYNPRENKWSNHMLEIIGLNEGQLPELKNSFDVIGYVNKELLGIDYDILVSIGGGDQAVGAIGAGTVNDGDLNISLGTSGVVFQAKDNLEGNYVDSIHAFSHANGKYHVMGVMLSASASLEWISKQVDGFDYSWISEEMFSKDNSVLFLPYLVGERAPVFDPYIRGSFVNISITDDKYNLVAAVVEGVIFNLYQIFESLGESSCKKIVIIGGMSQNDAVCQLVADIFNKPVHILQNSEGAAFGASLLAYAAYNNKDISDVCADAIRTSKTFEPKKSYSKKYEKYLKIYDSIKEI